MIFGRLKRRWPIVKGLRVDYKNALYVVMCAAILHNAAVKWADSDDDLPADMAPPLDHDDRPANDRFRPGMPEAARRLVTRREGEVAREHMRVAMPPPTNSEIRKM